MWLNYLQDKFDGYECDCAPGFYGADCEIEVDECVSHPCLNGNCSKMPLGSGGYSCKCFEGYKVSLKVVLYKKQTLIL